MSNLSAQIGQYVNLPQGENVEKVREAFSEIEDALLFISAKQQQIKDIKQMLKEDYDMTPKSITFISKILAKDNAEQVFEEQSELEALYETLYKGNN